MIQKSIKRLPRSEVEVTVTVPRSVIMLEVDRLFEEASKDVVVPGFRPGKVPLPILAREIDRDRLLQKVLEKILPQTLIEVLKSEDIIPIDHPRYVITQSDPDKDLVYRATVVARPTVVIKDYKGINVTRPKEKKVEEKEIHRVLTEVFSRWKKEKKGPPKPEDRIVPDDAFAKAIGAKDLATLRTRIRTKLMARYRYETEQAFEGKLLSALLLRATIDLPSVLVEDELSRIIGRLQQIVTQAKQSFEDYLRKEKKSLEELRDTLRPQAERNVKIELLLQHIGREENIEVTPEEIAAQFPQGETKRGNDGQDEAVFNHVIRQAKTLQLLKESVRNSP